MRRHSAALAAAALLFLASGCSRSPKVNFYTLSAAAPPLARGEALAPSVSVGPVTLPEVVDRPQLVVRVAPNRVEVLETQRWAEPLKREIPRLLAQNIGLLLGSERVFSYGQGAGADARYRVLVDIVRLEAVPGESVTLEAHWSIRGPGGAKRGGRSLVQEKAAGAGYEALVAACSRALAGMSDDIAKAIRAEAAAAP